MNKAETKIRVRIFLAMVIAAVIAGGLALWRQANVVTSPKWVTLLTGQMGWSAYNAWNCTLAITLATS